ncbi:MAG: DMT family transporter [Aestuariivirga sp.]|nr:DMT family transporter [Aestuariivirga sp.]
MIFEIVSIKFRKGVEPLMASNPPKIAPQPNLQGNHLLIASRETTAVLFVIAAACTWGLTGVLSKYLLGSTAPMIVALIQLSSSMLVSWIIVTVKFEKVEISGRFLVASVLGVLHPGLSTTLGIVGLVHLDASISSTIWALEAAMTMVLASMILAEKLSVIQVVLTIVSVGGVFFMTMNGDQMKGLTESLYGASLIFIAVACCALYAVFSRQISKDSAADPLLLVAGQQTIGLLVSLAMFPFHWSAERLGELSTMSIDIWLVCALSGTLTFLVAMGLFLAALRYLSAGFASSFLILTPIFGLASAFLLLGEVLTGLQWIGVLIILVSVLGIQYANSNSER